MPVDGRIVIPPPVAIDIAGIVVGDIHDLDLTRLDNDDLFLLTDDKVLE